MGKTAPDLRVPMIWMRCGYCNIALISFFFCLKAKFLLQCRLYGKWAVQIKDMVRFLGN